MAERSEPTTSIRSDPGADEAPTGVVDFHENASPSRSGRTILVLALRKRQRTFVNMITVGRAVNNDIVIPDLSVSKFHDYFRVPADGSDPVRSGVELCDSDSSNGTWVDDARLATKEPAFVQVGAAVRFGR